jgi:cell division protein FtsB
VSQLDAAQFRELLGRVEQLTMAVEAQKTAIATLSMRLNSLQGQINSLRAGRAPSEPLPDAPASTRGDDDAARQ